MKKTCFLRIIALIIVFVFSFPMYYVGATANTSADITANLTKIDKTDGYNLICEDGDLKLFLNAKTTNFYVVDTLTGNKTYAFPENIEENDTLTPAQKVELQSSLVFTFWDVERKTENVKYSDGVCIKQGSYSVYEKENGFVIKYELKSQKVTVCLSVTLEDGKLICNIPAGSIIEGAPDKQLLLNIAVLPYMIRGLGDTEGSIVLPDGSGEILDFSLSKSSEASYSKPIYGRNLSTSLAIEHKTGYTITCPYLAFEGNGKGILAIPVKGAGVGYVNANPAGKTTPYANAYFSFVYRASDIAVIGDIKSSTAQSTRIFDDASYNDDITITYQFKNENASLAELAKMYGEYLSAGSEAIGALDRTVVFDIYGYVNERRNLFGIPYTFKSVLSKGADILELANDDSFNGAIINLKSVTKAHQSHKIQTDVRPINKIISLSEISSVNASNVKIYISSNFLSFKKGTFWANSFFGASKTIYGSPVGVHEYNESTHLANKNVSKSFLLKPSKIEKTVEKLLNSSKSIGIDGISSDELCSISYHDYSSKGTLADAHRTQELAASIASKDGGLILSNPFDYAMKYCSAVTDIPVTGSNNDLCSGSYPFLQLAIGGNIPYTTEAINLNRSPETLFLTALTTGSVLHYDFILSDTEPINGTELNYLYSADYDSFKEMAKRQFDAHSEIKKVTENSRIKEYFKEGSIVTTVFENGAKLVVNFDDKKYSISK